MDISSISPLSHTFVKGDLWVTVTARSLSVALNVFAPNVLSEGVCQAEDNPSCDVTIEA